MNDLHETANDIEELSDFLDSPGGKPYLERINELGLKLQTAVDDARDAAEDAEQAAEAEAEADDSDSDDE